MKILFATSLLFCFFIVTITCKAQEFPSFQWAKSFGGNLGEEATATKVDASGNMFVVGFFVSATVDFDPGPAIVNLTSSGSRDIFISKFDPNGNLIWARAVGGTDDDVVNALALDNSGNVYVTGYFNGTVDFDPGATTFNLNSVGSADVFVLKLNTHGDFMWAGQIGGTQFEQAYDIALDNSGNIYATGYFLGTADFDPGTGTSNLTADDQDSFVVKLDNAGNFQWAKKFGNLSTDRGRSIVIDGAGNVIISGGVYGYTAPFDFDPGPVTVTLTPNTTPGQWDIYVAKLNSTNGDIVWAKVIAGTLWDIDEAIAVDNLNNILLTGYFEATTDFDPGIGIFEITAVGLQNPFIVKLNSSGDFVWAKSFANSSSTGSPASSGRNITTDPVGNIYATGAFQRTVDFDPGPSIFNLTAVGQSDAYISKLDASGNFIWAYKIGTANSESALGIAVTSSDHVYVSGLFSSIADFDPGACTFNLTSIGNIDAFIQKISFGAPAPDPTITSFSPLSGPTGTTVTITGTNFNTTPANNTIAFNGTPAVVTASTSTSITTTVPASATTGKISVTVNCVTVQSVADFIIGAPSPPTITSFTPVSGSVGTTVIITGTNFSATPASNSVTFNGVAAIVSASTTTSITTTVPTGAITGKISVTVGGNTATSADDFTVTTGTNQPPVIEATTTAVPIEGIITIDLEPLISDPDDNLDPGSVYLVSSVSEQGASASLNVPSFTLTLNYGGVQFFGEDQVTIGVCDLSTACTEQELKIEVGGDITVYNALSPNGDGKNDLLVIQYIDILPETQSNKVTIFNRWGDVVFEVSDYNNDDRAFRGVSDNGKDLPSGTYFYKIDFAGNRSQLTGFLSLKR